jgi:non-ribosomal peptide synthetase component F
MVNLLQSMQQTLKLGTGDALLAVTPLTFDIAGLELFLPLITGARLVFAPEGASGDGAHLREFLRREEITVMQATPFTWQLLLDAGWHDNSKFKVLCGGETLPVDLAMNLKKAAGHVWNCYGPTETTVYGQRWSI